MHAYAPSPKVEGIHLPLVRLASEDLWMPTALREGADKRHRATLIIDMSDAASRDHAARLMKLGSTLWERAIQGSPVQGPPPHALLARGDGIKTKDGAVREGFAGNVVLQTVSKERPTLIGPEGDALDQDDGSIYPGAWAHAIITITASSWGAHPGVYATLQGLKFVRHDTHIGWAKKAGKAKVTAADFGPSDPAKAH